MSPRREASRPLLPQHARHCPVLEAGSALGFMVYAPLEPKESLFVEFEGDGRYRFVYYLLTSDGKRTPIFQVTMSLSVGGIGMMKEEVTFVGAPVLSREAALAVMRAFLVPEDMGRRRARGPRGRPTSDRQVGTRLLADPQHDRAPGGTDAGDQVETDWYAHRPSSATCCRRRRHHHRAQHPDRSGVLCAARGDHDAAVHQRRDQGDRGRVRNSTRSRPRRRRDVARPVHSRTISGKAALRRSRPRSGAERAPQAENPISVETCAARIVITARMLPLLGAIPQFHGEHAGPPSRHNGATIAPVLNSPR
jgi:hypothetical protein